MSTTYNNTINNNQGVKTKGLRFSRRHTQEGVSPFEMFGYEERSSAVYNGNGEVSAIGSVEVPQGWSQVSTDKLVKNYFLQAGVPSAGVSVKEAAHHMASAWRSWGERCGYFASEADGQVFYDELAYSILSGSCVPNASHWLRTCIQAGGGESRQVEQQAEVKVEGGAVGRQCKQPHSCFLLGLMNKVMEYGDGSKQQ